MIFVISGPSGSGKTTLLGRLLRHKALKGKLAKTVSFTTRPRRSGEKDGRDYFFITQKEFRKFQRAKKILEWTKYLGYYYATPRDFLQRHLKQGRHLALCLDLKGALRIKRLYPKDTALIFILPPSLRALQKRIRGRCHLTRGQEIKERLRLARQELLCSRRYDYCIVNKNLAQAVKELKGIVLKKNHI